MNFKQNETGYFELIDEKEKSISYPDDGNDTSYSIEEGSYWFQARNKLLLKFLKKYPFKGGFLDVGGGNGYQIKFFQEKYFKPLGINSALCEPGKGGCKNAVTRGAENVYCCTFHQFPFNKINIGGIGLFDVLEHIEDDSKFLSELSDLLPTGSRIYITVPALNCLWSNEDNHGGHFRRFNKKHTRRIAKETKLKIIYQTYFFSYYVPLVWLLRVLPEKLGNKKDYETIKAKEISYHKQSGIITSVLKIFNSLELFLISIGIKPIVGTSRLIILEKSL